jgi:tRNA dimethylallyltransferase
MTNEQTKQPIFVSGATGCGKSDLGIYLAQRLNGEIVNCDSVQVYKGAVIGSARVSDAELSEVPHHLIGHVRPDEPYSVGRYLREFAEVERDIQSRGKRVIVVGGSTLYIRSLIHGIASLPPENVSFRESLLDASTGELYAKLVEADPSLAGRYHSHDRVRIVRALELIQADAVAHLRQHEEFITSRYERTPIIIIPVYDRVVLWERLRARAEQMISDGLMLETATMFAEYGSCAKPLSSVGYSQAMMSLSRAEKHGMSEAELADEIAIASRRYAKRQTTFWRNEPVKMGWQTVHLHGYSQRVFGLDSVEKFETKKGLPRKKGTFAWELSREEILSELEQDIQLRGGSSPKVLYLAAPRLKQT